MRVERIMKRGVRTCRPDDRLSTAAQIMWECDCGCVPVVEAGDVVGMLTDRDVCMAAYTQGRALADIPVESAMAREVSTCRAGDAISTALETLERKQLHRLPVLDEHGRLAGMLSLADVAAEAEQPGRTPIEQRLGEVVEAISRPRPPHDGVVAA